MALSKEKGSIGFRIFVITIEIIIITAILGGAWLINKLLLAPPLIVSFRIVRVKIETKYDIWHLATITACMIISTLICVLGLYISLPISISLISNIVVGGIFSVITWKIQEHIDALKYANQLQIELGKDKTFNVNNCTREELIARCEKLKFSKRNTELAIEFFINKTNQKELANKLYIEEKSVSMQKFRLKNKLNNIRNK